MQYNKLDTTLTVYLLKCYAFQNMPFQNFTVESILLANLDTEHRLVAEEEGIKFYSKYSFLFAKRYYHLINC